MDSRENTIQAGCASEILWAALGHALARGSPDLSAGKGCLTHPPSASVELQNEGQQVPRLAALVLLLLSQ